MKLFSPTADASGAVRLAFPSGADALVAGRLEAEAGEIGAEAAARASAPAGLGESLAGWVRGVAACLRDAPAEDWPEKFALVWITDVLAQFEVEPAEGREILCSLETSLATVAPDLVGWKIGRILHRLGESADHFAWAGALGRGNAELAERLDAPAARRGLAWRPLLHGALAAVLAGEAGMLRRLAFSGHALFGGASAEEWSAFASELVEASRAHASPAASEELAAVLAGVTEALALGEERRGADMALARAAGEFLRRGPTRGTFSAVDAEQVEQQLVFLADLAIRARATQPNRAAAHAELRRSFETWLRTVPQPNALPLRENGPALAAAWLDALREPLGSRHRLLAALGAALPALRPLDSAERAGRISAAHDGEAAQEVARHLWVAGSAPHVVRRKEGLLLRRLSLDATAIPPVVPTAFAEAWEGHRRDWFPAERAAVLGRLRSVVAGLGDAPAAKTLLSLIAEAADPIVTTKRAVAAVSTEPKEASSIPTTEAKEPSPSHEASTEAKFTTPEEPPVAMAEAAEEESALASEAAAKHDEPPVRSAEAPLESAEESPIAEAEIPQRNTEAAASTEEEPAGSDEASAPELESAAGKASAPSAGKEPETAPPTTEADEPIRAEISPTEKRAAQPKDEVDLFLASAAKPPPEARRSPPARFILRRSGPPPGALLSFSPAMFAPPMTRLVDPPPRPSIRSTPAEKPGAAPPATAPEETSSPPLQEAGPDAPSAVDSSASSPETMETAAPEKPAASESSAVSEPDSSEASADPTESGEKLRKRTVSWPPSLADAPPVTAPLIRAETTPPIDPARETVLLPAPGATPPSASEPVAPVEPPTAAEEAEPAEPPPPPPPPGPAWPTFAPPVFPPRFVLTEQVLGAPSLDWRARARVLADRLLENAHEAAVQRAARWRGMDTIALGDKLAALNVILADGLAPAEWSGHLDPEATEGWVAWLDSQPPELWRAAEDWLVALGTEAAAPSLGFTARLRLLDYLGLLRDFHRQAAMVREVASALAATGEPDALRMAGVLVASLGRGSGPAAIWRLHRLALEQLDAPPDAAALSARAGLTPDQTRCLFTWLESLEMAGDAFAQGVRLRVWLGGEKAASDLPAAEDREALFLFAALASACAGSKPAFAAQLRLWAVGTLPEIDSEAGRATWSEIFARLPVRLPPEGLPAVRTEWDALRRAVESFDRLHEMAAGLSSFEANLRDALGELLDGDAHALARRQLPAALLLIARETAAPLAPLDSGRMPTPLRFTEDEAWRALTRIPPAADRALVEMLRSGAADSPEAALWVLFRRLASERVALETAFGEIGSFRTPRVADLPLTTAALERQWIAAPSPAGELAAQAARRECLATWLHPGGSAKAATAALPTGSAPLDEMAHRYQQLFTRLAGSLKLPTPMRERFQVLVRRLPALTAAARLRAAFPNAAASSAAALATVVSDALEENRRCQLSGEDATRLDEAVRDILSREETAALTNAVSPGVAAFGEAAEPDPTQWRAWRLTQLLRG